MVFPRLPFLLAEEEIKLYWKSLLRGFELAHHVSHIAVDEGVGGKVAVGPTAEEGEVDLLGSGSKTARNGGCVAYLLFGEIGLFCNLVEKDSLDERILLVSVVL